MNEQEMKALRSRVMNALERGADSGFSEVRGSEEPGEANVIYAVDNATQLDIIIDIGLM